MNDSFKKFHSSILGCTEEVDTVLNQFAQASVAGPSQVEDQLCSLLSSKSGKNGVWTAHVILNSKVLDEVQFWFENLNKLNCTDLVKSSKKCHYVAYSDASGSGFGGYVVSGIRNETSGVWSIQEMKLSSTFRELEAVRRVFMENVDVIQGCSVKWHTDNSNVANILQVGSRKEHLHEIVMSISELCRVNKVGLFPEWIPRAQNQRADLLSKCGDSDDWEISFQVFQIFQEAWGPYSVDRFASFYNAKCHRFNSRFWCPKTEAVNALTQFWGADNNWVVPPPSLILQSIKKLLAEKAKATLVVPRWPSASWWPTLFHSMAVKEFRAYPTDVAIVKGRGKNGIFSGQKNSFDMLFVRLSF
jgi:hypothetical protein